VGQTHALGNAGHGVGPSRLVGKIVCDVLLTRETDLTALPFVSERSVPCPVGRALCHLLSVRAERGLAKIALRILQ
jgi:hypothetical protein